MKNNFIINGILGVVVGDALGVPVEFRDREYLKKNPIETMTGNGTYNLPVGTWSDDSSMTLCLAEELLYGVDIEKIGKSFVLWMEAKKWTPHGKVFDIGKVTSFALGKIQTGIFTAEESGSYEENSNGNGSLMRILPLLLETRKITKIEQRYELVRKISSITHAHVRSSLSCFYYLELANFLIDNKNILDCYHQTNISFLELCKKLNLDTKELKHFERITNGEIHEMKENQIFSDGYVIHTLESALWCLLNSSNYRETVLQAVNLGKDTDTTAAVAGGLAGICYDSIPEEWLSQIIKIEEIKNLLIKLSEK